MSYLKHTGYGRTRRPKNITGADGTAVSGSNASALQTLTASAHHVASNGIYETENQRFLHIHASGSSSGCTNVYTYLYATQRWSELVLIDPTDGSRNSVVCGANQHVVVEIAGADLVAFATSPGGVYAAGSTF